MKSYILNIILGLCLAVPLLAIADDNDELLSNVDLAIEEIKHDRETGICVDRFESERKYQLTEVQIKFLQYPLEGLERWKAEYKKHAESSKVKKSPLEFYKTNRMYSHRDLSNKRKYNLFNTGVNTDIPSPCKTAMYHENIYKIVQRNKVNDYVRLN